MMKRWNATTAQEAGGDLGIQNRSFVQPPGASPPTGGDEPHCLPRESKIYGKWAAST